MNLSATAARKAERTTTYLVLIVDAASPLPTKRFTQDSICDFRIDLIGKSARPVDAILRSALARVESTQTCRSAQSA